ncbi:MAG: hypothetical protein IPO22_02365 [Anaerolineales bacterium]|nr:hypothetical protein [Anaerolineales bacterium]
MKSASPTLYARLRLPQPRRTQKRSQTGEDPAKQNSALLQLTVRGVPCVYYGEEIGATDLPQPFNTAMDPVPQEFRIHPTLRFRPAQPHINRDEIRRPCNGTRHRTQAFRPQEGMAACT